MKKKLDKNAKKAFMDYKLEMSKEIGAIKDKTKKTHKLDTESKYNHLGRS